MLIVNLPRASSLYGSTSNLSSGRAFRGSNPNLASHPGSAHSFNISTYFPPPWFQNLHTQVWWGRVPPPRSRAWSRVGRDRGRKLQGVRWRWRSIGIMGMKKGVIGTSAMEHTWRWGSWRLWIGSRMRTLLPQVDLSPDSKGKPALKRTAGDSHLSTALDPHFRCSVSFSNQQITQLNSRRNWRKTKREAQRSGASMLTSLMMVVMVIVIMVVMVVITAMVVSYFLHALSMFSPCVICIRWGGCVQSWKTPRGWSTLLGIWFKLSSQHLLLPQSPSYNHHHYIYIIILIIIIIII